VTHAYGYLRVSGRGQLDGDGFARQRAAIEMHAENHGLRIVRWFEERATPGATEWEDRPAWSEMIAYLNGIRTIVIERLDRLARDLMVQEHIALDLARRQITLVSTAEPDLGSSDPTRVLFRQIMGAIAQYDKAMVVQKLRSARQRIKARGEACEGRKPFGYYVAERETLSKIAALHHAGHTATAIARELNVSGLKPRFGQQWHPYVVSRIISSVQSEITIDKSGQVLAYCNPTNVR
jgi:DNA invertase Pin-like site-specific DNA recombinase